MSVTRRTSGNAIPQNQNPTIHRLIQGFDLLANLVWRDFSLRYKRSALGVLWSVILPLVQLIIFSVVFQVVVPLNIEAYPVYVFSALLPWTWFSASVGSASLLFISNRDLLRHPQFSPAMLIGINTLSNLISYLVALPILFVMLLAHHIYPQPTLLVLPILMLLESILIVGLSIAIATLNVFYRDIQHLAGVVLGLLFYVTPVFYRPQQSNHTIELVMSLNPVKAMIDAYRAAMYGQAIDWLALAGSTATSLVILGIGYLIYSSQQHKIFDNL